MDCQNVSILGVIEFQLFFKITLINLIKIRQIWKALEAAATTASINTYIVQPNLFMSVTDSN